MLLNPRPALFLALGLSCLLPSMAEAQDTDHAPWANKVGRFWGIGYDAGYHARYESRLGLKRPQSTEMGSNLFRNTNSVGHSTTSMFPRYDSVHADGHAHAGIQMLPSAPAPSDRSAGTPGQDAPVPVALPVKPLIPPPNWLREFLKPDASFESRTLETSPSDR